MALALPEAAEEDHRGRPSFRVRGRIFAVLWPAEGRGVLKLPLHEQAALVAADPSTFEPAAGWGRQGWTVVALAGADPDELAELLEEAWRGVAPARLLASFQGDTEPDPAA
jgi:hypothetical protein